MDNQFVLQTTYHTYNYGSILQCYASQLYFQSQGITCYLVIQKLGGAERLFGALQRRLRYYAGIRRYPDMRLAGELQTRGSMNSKTRISCESCNAIDTFVKKNINVLQRTYIQLRSLSRNKNCLFCLAGSDQIWNAARVHIDPVYFLTFAPRTKRVALAPSFSCDAIPLYNKVRFGTYIAGFHKISVREESGKAIVRDVAKRDAIVLLDPVFLMGREFWQSFSARSARTETDYVFAFFLDTPSENALNTLHILAKHGRRVYMLGYYHEVLGKELCPVFLNGGPEDFVHMINCAEIVCTDSFHATAFSVLLHKQFYVFARNYTGNDQSARLTDFLHKVNLFKQYDCRNPADGILKEVDFRTADSVIADNLKKTEQYITL